MVEATANPIEAKGLAHLGGDAGQDVPPPQYCPICGGNPVRLEVVRRKEDGTRYHTNELRCGKCGWEIGKEPSSRPPLFMSTGVSESELQQQLGEAQAENVALRRRVNELEAAAIAAAAKKIEPQPSKKSAKA